MGYLASFFFSELHFFFNRTSLTISFRGFSALLHFKNIPHFTASVWDSPEEGFISIEEQNKAAAEAARSQEAKDKSSSEEVRAFAAREAMKKFRKEEEKQPIEEYPGPILGPTPKPEPYGRWTTIRKM